MYYQYIRLRYALLRLLLITLYLSWRFSSCLWNTWSTNWSIKIRARAGVIDYWLVVVIYRRSSIPVVYSDGIIPYRLVDYYRRFVDN